MVSFPQKMKWLVINFYPLICRGKKNEGNFSFEGVKHMLQMETEDCETWSHW